MKSGATSPSNTLIVCSSLFLVGGVCSCARGSQTPRHFGLLRLAALFLRKAGNRAFHAADAQPAPECTEEGEADGAGGTGTRREPENKESRECDRNTDHTSD